jgi:hypothetical protein
MSPEDRMIVDAPEKKRKILEVVDKYTAIYRKGCTRPMP